MKILEFKTNINSNDCVDKASPHLDAVGTIRNWEVATKNPKKILTVRGKSIEVNEVVKATKKAGFKVEFIRERIMEMA